MAEKINYFQFPRLRKKEKAKRADKFLKENFDLVCEAILEDKTKTYCERQRLKSELHKITDSVGFCDKKCFEGDEE